MDGFLVVGSWEGREPVVMRLSCLYSFACQNTALREKETKKMLVTAACVVAALVAVVLPTLANAVRQWWLLRSVPAPPVASVFLGHAPSLMTNGR